MRRIAGLMVFLSVIFLLATGVPAYPQGGTGSAQLNGTVHDASEGAVPKASITLRDPDTNRSYSTVSNDNGYYVLPNLSPGHYELTAVATGFAKYTQTGIVLSVAQVATVDIGLKVASVGEKVEVSTEIPPVEPTRTELSQVIDTRQIQ